MCKYCEEKEEILLYEDNKNNKYDDGFTINSEINFSKINGRVTYYTKDFYTDATFSMNINYCPFCGRKLGD